MLLTEGIAAYGDLEFVAAARLLSRALSPEQRPPLSGADRDRALMYLGSAQLNQTEREGAAAAFRTLVIANPRYRPDSLIFPPPVTRLFAEVVQTTKAVAVDLAAQQTLTAGTSFPIRIHASSAHQITATILGPAGDTVSALFDGPITDSLTFSWNGLGADQKPAASGSYRLEVASRLSPTTIARAIRIPLEIQVMAADSAPTPAPLPPQPPLPDSLLLPERHPVRPALAYLVPGVALGGLLMIPRGLGDGRFVIGGALAAGGVAGFFLRKPGQPIPDNIAANERVRRAWTRRAEAEREPAREPARQRGRMVIRAGPPERIEEGAR